MVGVGIWILMILIIAVLAGWLVENLPLVKYRIKFIDQDDHFNNQSLLGWISRCIRLWIRGNWTLQKQGMNEPVTQEGEITKVLLTLDVPAQSLTHISIESVIDDADKSVPSVRIQAEQDGSQIPINVKFEPAPGRSRFTKISASSLSASTGEIVTVPSRPIWGMLSLDIWLFCLAIVVYTGTRFIGLDRFPIYFFTDEAVHTLLAENLVNNQFRYNGDFLPVFFPMGSSFALNSISVYLQVLPYLLFGKSILVTRAVSVIISVFGAIAVSLILKEFFNSKYWWAGILILSTIPTWFLHSRTAFEYVELASFYALFTYFYLSYRLKSPAYLYLVILCGAMVFYTHGLGQILIMASAGILLLVDLPYHWVNRKTVLVGLLLILLLGMPYLRFVQNNPSLFTDQLRTRGSYWIDQEIDLPGKLFLFGKEYLKAFDPRYLFFSGGGQDLARHVMKNYGHFLFISFPFAVIGLWFCIKDLSKPAFRTILVGLLAAPIGAAFAQITILRILWVVVPVSILIVLGLESCLNWIEKRGAKQLYLKLGLVVVLVVGNVWMLRDSLVNGPLWFDDYGLYGMQYGAKQIFGEAIPMLLEKSPETKFVVTPTWANGTDQFLPFFLTPEQQKQVRLDSIQAYLFEKLPIESNTILVLTEAEFLQAVDSPKFDHLQVVDMIKYPNGKPGFYFIHLDYSEAADEIFLEEKLARSQPVEEKIMIGQEQATIRYSQIDMGQPEAIFDGDPYTLMRGLEANPFILDIEFDEPRPLNQIEAIFANMDFLLKALLYETLESEPLIYETEMKNVQGDPLIQMEFDGAPERVIKLRLEITSLNGGNRPHIHIRELSLVP